MLQRYICIQIDTCKKTIGVLWLLKSCVSETRWNVHPCIFFSYCAVEPFQWPLAETSLFNTLDAGTLLYHTQFPQVIAALVIQIVTLTIWLCQRKACDVRGTTTRLSRTCNYMGQFLYSISSHCFYWQVDELGQCNSRQREKPILLLRRRQFNSLPVHT